MEWGHCQSVGWVPRCSRDSRGRYLWPSVRHPPFLPPFLSPSLPPSRPPGRPSSRWIAWADCTLPISFDGTRESGDRGERERERARARARESGRHVINCAAVFRHVQSPLASRRQGALLVGSTADCCYTRTNTSPHTSLYTTTHTHTHTYTISVLLIRPCGDGSVGRADTA